MSLDPEMLTVGSQMVNSLSNATSAIFDRVRVAKEKTNHDETIKELEQIISELIDEKQQLYQTIQTYEEELIMKKISNEDVEYITKEIAPLLEKLMMKNTKQDEKQIEENFEMLSTLLSKETFKIMQLLGFNFKQAIGEPLTDLIRNLITSQNPKAENKQLDYKILNEEKLIEYMKVSQNEKAFERLQSML